MQESLRAAIDHHRRGELAAAEALYAQTIHSAPADAYALRCLASLLNQQGRFDEALVCFDRILSAQPHDAAVWNEHGGILATSGRIDRALVSFQRAAALDPDLAEPACNVAQSLCFLGRHSEALPWLDRALARRPVLPLAHLLKVDVLQSTGRHFEAAKACRQALALGPESANLQNALGSSLAALGQHPEALTAFDRALSLEPGHIDALNNRGNSLAALGRWDEALAAFAQALALKSDFPEALNNRGLVLAALDRYPEALESFEQALSYRPEYADALNSRGASLDALGRPEEALECFERALAARPDFPNALSNRGIVLVKLGRYAQALASLNAALAVRPDDTAALNSRGNALAALGRMDEAFASFESALAKRPNFIEALISYGSWLSRIGRADEGRRAVLRALKIDPNYPDAAGTAFDAAARCCDWGEYDSRARAIVDRTRAGLRVAAPFHMLLISDSPDDQLACARIWVRERYPPQRTESPALAPRNRERLRVAYLSPDFRGHPVARQACGLFERHDRTRFETIAVAFGQPARADPLRARLERAFDRFIEVPDSVSDREAAQQLRDLDIAIAVDLAGFTTDARPGVLAFRPAPVQVSFLGYPGTLGADYIDYIVADRTVVPTHHRQFYAERVVHLPDTFFVTDNERALAATPSRGEAGLPDEGFVYCCFNRSYKITPAMFDAWMGILQNVSGSVLWLSERMPVAVDNLRREAQRRGIAPERLVFAPLLPDAADHLARLRLADLFLDTLPYNAHATATDALWAGLPVLTCLGRSFAGRVAASLLQAVGLPELIVESLPEYEALACDLACHPARLRELRERLSGTGHGSALFDTDRFRRHLEWAYRSMWERSLRGEPPSHFAVPPT